MVVVTRIFGAFVGLFLYSLLGGPDLRTVERQGWRNGVLAYVILFFTMTVGAIAVAHLLRLLTKDRST
jgi:hypothetical protein